MGRRLAALRQRQGLTQVDVAKAVALSENGYRNYEKGLATIPATRIRKWADALHTSPARFVHALGIVEEEPSRAAVFADLMKRDLPLRLLVERLVDAWDHMDDDDRLMVEQVIDGIVYRFEDRPISLARLAEERVGYRVVKGSGR